MAKKVSWDVEGQRQKCPRGPLGVNVGLALPGYVELKGLFSAILFSPIIYTCHILAGISYYLPSSV